MDLITHVPSLAAMLAEARAIQSDENNALAKYFTIDEDGQGATFNVAKVPVTHSSNGATICLVRGVSRAIIEASSSIKVLGECINGEYVFDSDNDKLIYESIYDTKSRMIDDGEGGKVEFTPPYKIGVFS
ncbi:hypothetical protein [Colwellia psychrerythraea]|uniref:Uncharacterized protein n=1 Tax=Colwellia psychrerythraea TaxID=28229 RepID=A0A099KGQ7_COLPS|nr:hypothetical protein [Colwellia psychrerythraea]KGJ88803.1 hypothetical protein ND2E_0096 [Colwellia psychrerythraea]